MLVRATSPVDACRCRSPQPGNHTNQGASKHAKSSLTHFALGDNLLDSHRQTIIDDVINDGPAVHNHPAHVELQQQHACSLALRSALSEVVRQLDPNHPLVKDLFLQSKIRKAGLTAFTLVNLDYNAACTAGLSFVLAKPAAKDAG